MLATEKQFGMRTNFSSYYNENYCKQVATLVLLATYRFMHLIHGYMVKDHGHLYYA